MNTHTISILVENQHGALSRVAGLFSARGYNITSLSVAETEDPEISRMTIVVAGDESVLEQVVKQLNRLVDVIKVLDFEGETVIELEAILLEIDADKSNRHEIASLVNIFGGKVVSVAPSSITIQLTASSDTLNQFITMIKPYGIKELVRSGKVALAKTVK